MRLKVAAQRVLTTLSLIFALFLLAATAARAETVTGTFSYVDTGGSFALRCL